jgi:hypothetical protein
MRPVDNRDLERWRALDAAVVIERVCSYVKRDPDYRPTPGNATTVRLHATTADAQYELLATGAKWFDVRAKKGGGGAIDLVMHLDGLTFKKACVRLRELEL